MKIVLVLLCLISFHVTFSQELEALVIYEATLINDNIVDSSFDIHLSTKQDVALSEKAVLFHLIIDGNEAIYRPEYDLPTKRKLGFKYDKTAVIALHDRIYYTNSDTGESSFQSFWIKDILVSTDTIEWELEEESKKVGQHICYKATAEIHSKQLSGMDYTAPVTAWYTTEIPISVGVQNFNGLPGLIMELDAHHEKGTVRFTALDIQLPPKHEIEIERPIGKNKISHEEFLRMIEKLNKNRM